MSTATALLPVVRMCDNPDCGGWGACDRIRSERRTMGITEWLGPDVAMQSEDYILRVITQELSLSAASDSAGALHVIPPGTQFTIHTGHGGIPADKQQAGKEAYVVVYSGPDMDLDEILAGSPLVAECPNCGCKLDAMSTGFCAAKEAS